MTHVVCAQCALDAMEQAPCGNCGSTARRTFATKADLQRFRDDRKAHGLLAEVRQPAARRIVPGLLLLFGFAMTLMAVFGLYGTLISGQYAWMGESIGSFATGAALMLFGMRSWSR